MVFIILKLFYTINLICLHDSLHTPESGYFLPYILCMALHFLLDKIQNTAWWTTLSTMGSWLPNSSVLWSCHLPQSKWVKAQPRSLRVPKKPTFLPTPKAIRTLILPESPPQPYLQAEPNTFKVMTTIHSGTIKNYLLLTLIPVSINHEKPRTFIHPRSLHTVSDSLLPKALITIQPDITFFLTFLLAFLSPLECKWLWEGWFYFGHWCTSSNFNSIWHIVSDQYIFLNK